MPDGGIPIIRLTLEGMKIQVLHAFLQYEASLAEETRKAVEEYCTPENIQRVVSQEVTSVLNAAVRAEVDRFYRYGNGRRVVEEAVRAVFEREQP